jgi:hypothetical protein
MAQFVGPAPAALDYNSAIIGALELSEKKWVLAVQLPGVTRATDSPGDAAAPAGANTDLRKRGERARRIVGSA